MCSNVAYLRAFSGEHGLTRTEGIVSAVDRDTQSGDITSITLDCGQKVSEDSEFWRYCKNMDVPDSLTHKMELFASSGRVGRDADDLFREASWVQLMLGLRVMPSGHDPMAMAFRKSN